MLSKAHVFALAHTRRDYCVVINLACHSIFAAFNRIHTCNCRLALQGDVILGTLTTVRWNDDGAVKAFTDDKRFCHDALKSAATYGGRFAIKGVCICGSEQVDSPRER
jgi:hypothetical protein